MIFFKFLSLGIKSKAYRQLGMQLKNGKRQLGFLQQSIIFLEPLITMIITGNKEHLFKIILRSSLLVCNGLVYWI